MKNAIKICLITLGLSGYYNAGAQSYATYYTSMGNFVVRLTDTLTPVTVDSFIARVTTKFYDGLIFHRVIDNFVIQGGDPLGDGTGGPGYETNDEFDPSLKNVPGSLAMANSGPNTNGSQFYFNLINNAYLNTHYTVFGMVTSNFSVVKNIGHVATNANDKPLTNVVIDSIRMTQLPTVVNNIASGKAIAMYPNPCKGKVTIALPQLTSQLELVNMLGGVVHAATGKGLTQIDVTGLPNGLYMVRITNTDGLYTGRLVVE